MSRAHSLEKRFVNAGHSVFHAPVTQINARAAAKPVGLHDGLIVTSASAVDCLPEVDTDLPCLATGPATATALQGRGFKTVSHFSGEMSALLDHLAAQVRSGARRWLYPCGTTLSYTPKTLMDASGAQIDAWPVYSADDAGPWTTQTLEALTTEHIDWTVFLSIRTAKLFVRNARSAQIWPDGPPGKAACISAGVADPLRTLGYGEICVGEEKTTSSLVAAMGLTYC